MVHAASACLSAHQNRIFPIGTCEKGLVVLEVHLDRDDNIEGEDGRIALDDPMWYGKVYCNIYNYYELWESDTLGVLKEFKESALIELLKPYRLQCIESAKKLPGFTPAEKESITFYGYSTGAGVSIVADTMAQTASVKISNSIEADIPLFALSFPLYEDYQAYYGDVVDTAEYITGLKQGLLVGSARRYNIGKQKLYIVHLESGQHYPDLEGDKIIHAAESKHFIETGLFTEPVMHHGHGFDFYILE